MNTPLKTVKIAKNKAKSENLSHFRRTKEETQLNIIGWDPETEKDTR